MKGKVYRIRRTKLADDTVYDSRLEGHVSYLEPFGGSSGRKYRFRTRPTICNYCRDQHDSIDFPSLSEARKKLRSAAVKEYFRAEMDWDQTFDRIEIVEVTYREHPARFIGLEIPDGHYAVHERVLWPVPPLLERLAAIL